jgi:hypothetical protein
MMRWTRGEGGVGAAAGGGDMCGIYFVASWGRGAGWERGSTGDGGRGGDNAGRGGGRGGGAWGGDGAGGQSTKEEEKVS